MHAPGFYLHLGLDQSYAAGGLWHPETGQQQQIRAAIDRDQAAWRAARRALEQGGFAMGGDSLKRPPRGYAGDHLCIMSTPLDVATITAPAFADRLRTAWSHLVPMMRFLTEAVQLPF